MTPGGAAGRRGRGASRWRPQLPLVLALALLLAAVLLPPLTLPQPTWRYLVTFDITQSMDVEDSRLDGAPASRLALARAAAALALDELPCGSTLAWAVFTGYRVMPLSLPLEVCRHREPLLASLERIDGRMRWAEASNVGKGVTWAIRSAQAIDDATRVVFLSDGHESPPLRENEQPPMGDIEPGQVPGFVVGVGGELALPIPRSNREGERIGTWQAGDVVQGYGAAAGGGLEHLSALREPHLRALARLTGLQYRRLDEPRALARAMLDPALAQSAPAPAEPGWLPALAALLLLAWSFRPQGMGLAAWRGLRRRRATEETR